MRVVNLRKEKYTHYIGRPSIFGNPFIIGKDGTREQVIEKYSDCLRHGINELNIIEAIKKLPEDAILGCYCKPLPCHGDVIIKIWEELHENNK
jgi:hypothetical protein